MIGKAWAEMIAEQEAEDQQGSIVWCISCGNHTGRPYCPGCAEDKARERNDALESIIRRQRAKNTD